MTLKERSKNLYTKLRIRFTDEIHKRLGEIEEIHQSKKSLKRENSTASFKQVVKVEHQYRVRDNIELDYFIEAQDPRKRFFIHEMIDFDKEILSPR